MSAKRTPNQILATDVAVAIFRALQLTKLDVQWMHEPTRERITNAVDGYASRDANIVSRIAAAYPSLPIELPGGRYHARTWARMMATEVIIRVMQDVTGMNPVWGEQDEADWVFLGHMLRTNYAQYASPLPQALVVNNGDLVDLWGTLDGQSVRAVAGPGESWIFHGHTGGLGQGNSYIREALRRLKVLTDRLPAAS